MDRASIYSITSDNNEIRKDIDRIFYNDFGEDDNATAGLTMKERHALEQLANSIRFHKEKEKTEA